jgi:purine-binding chemotaxis protein CheW
MDGNIKTLISFYLGDQLFAFDSLMVRNILPYEGKVTHVPNSRDFILGVINLHGNIVPITDMRKMMNFESKEYTKDTSIIVVSPEDKLESQFGIVVDLVKEVFEIQLDAINPSSFEKGMGLIDHFEGKLQLNNEFIHLIDLLQMITQIESKK